MADEGWRDNPTWCGEGHARVGLVTNQDPDDYDPSEPHASVAVCNRKACLNKAVKYVAGSTNRQATYYDDAERRARKAAADADH